MTERKPYPTDLTDEQWALIAPLLPEKTRGRPPVHPRRDMVNALLYMAGTGCQWRMLPHDLPPWEAIYAFWRGLVDSGALEQINEPCVSKSGLKKTAKPIPVWSLWTANLSKRLKKGGLRTRPVQAP